LSTDWKVWVSVVAWPIRASCVPLSDGCAASASKAFMKLSSAPASPLALVVEPLEAEASVSDCPRPAWACWRKPCWEESEEVRLIWEMTCWLRSESVSCWTLSAWSPSDSSPWGV
jgi:hypothetical protein